jgi:hypothetical protein
MAEELIKNLLYFEFRLSNSKLLLKQFESQHHVQLKKIHMEKSRNLEKPPKQLQKSLLLCHPSKCLS